MMTASAVFCLEPGAKVKIVRETRTSDTEFAFEARWLVGEGDARRPNGRRE